MLDLVGQTDAHVAIADRGWCAACAIGRCSSPWQATLDETTSLLASLDARLAHQVTVERNELPIARAEPIASSLRPDKHVGRRQFLRRFVTPEPRDDVSESRRVVFGRGIVTPLKRRRVLERIGALAVNREQDMPAELMPGIKIADGCDLKGLCAAVCPTSALRRIENDDTISLQFAAADCIACGECERVCPSKALSLWPGGDGTLPRGPVTVRQQQTVACVSCGDSFVPSADEQSCPLCAKTANLMHEVSELKFGSPASVGRETNGAP